MSGDVTVEYIEPSELIVEQLGAGGGAGGPPTVSRAAGADLSALRAVAIGPGNAAVLVSPGDVLADAVFGVTLQAALLGAPVTIQTAGDLLDGGWAWTPGPVYLGAAGTLTQVLPVAGAIVRVGEATGPTTLNVNPRLVARL